MNKNEVIQKIKLNLPLKIDSINWDGTILNMYGPKWNFTTMSAWRLKENNHVRCGCFDKNSIELIEKFKQLQIIDLNFTDDSLMDPVFFLSNGIHLEIFATDTYEPWIFHMDQLGSFIPPIIQ